MNPKYYYNVDGDITDGKITFDTNTMSRYPIRNDDGDIWLGSDGLLKTLNRLADEKTTMLEIVDAHIRGVESEKGIDPDNEKFQYAMNHTLNWLKRLREDLVNPNQYLRLKKNERHTQTTPFCRRGFMLQKSGFMRSRERSPSSW